MKYYPINLDMKDRSCLVVGGGEVGTRKARGLIICGARVTVVSPEGTEGLIELAAGNQLQWLQRQYTEPDVHGMFLVFGATDTESLNRQVAEDARKQGALCNVADRPDLCDFILPSVIRQGDLSVAISTAGKSPAVAKYLRQELSALFGEEYATLLRLMGSIRSRLLEGHGPEAHRRIFRALLQQGILERLREGDIAAVNGLMLDTIGPGYHFDELMNPGG